MPRASRLRSGPRALGGLAAVAALLACGALAPGCVEYTERQMCSMGSVLNEEGDCVAPPVRDGGVAIESCDELCAMAPDITEEQLGCLRELIMMAGPLPSACADLATTDGCQGCITAVGLDDMACSLATSCL
jgi:hypothetical protein